MEILLLLLALLSRQNKTAEPDFLQTLGKFLENGNPADILKSDWFRTQKIGRISGKEIADALEGAEKLTSGNLLNELTGKNGASVFQLLQEVLPALSSLLTKSAPAYAKQESGWQNPLAPIAAIADAQIIYCLNRYICSAA